MLGVNQCVDSPGFFAAQHAAYYPTVQAALAAAQGVNINRLPVPFLQRGDLSDGVEKGAFLPGTT